MQIKTIPVVKLAFKKIYFLLLFVSFSVTSQDLSLTKAYELMLKNNGDLAASNFEIIGAEEEKKAAEALYFPTICLGANYVHLNEDIQIDFNEKRPLVSGILGLPDPNLLGNWNFTLQEKDLAFASADVKWPLFAGGKIRAANKAAQTKFQLAKNNYVLTENKLVQDLVTFYYKFKLAKEIENLRLQVFNTIQIHNSHANKLFENGLIAEVETLNAKVALANAKRELKAAQNDVSLAKTALKNLIGSTNFTIASTKFIQPITHFSLENLQTEMLQQNNQLKILSITEELASTAVKIEASEYFPKIAFLGKRSIWKENLPLFKTKWMVGVGAQWNVFDGFKRAHKIKTAKAKVAQVQSLKQQAESNLVTYTEKLYNELQKQQNQYFSLTNEIALAEKLKFMRTRAFEEGTGTSLEVVNASLQLSQIQLQQLKSLYLYNITYAELMIKTNKIENILTQL